MIFSEMSMSSLSASELKKQEEKAIANSMEELRRSLIRIKKRRNSLRFKLSKILRSGLRIFSDRH